MNLNDSALRKGGSARESHSAPEGVVGRSPNAAHGHETQPHNRPRPDAPLLVDWHAASECARSRIGAVASCFQEWQLNHTEEDLSSRIDASASELSELGALARGILLESCHLPPRKQCVEEASPQPELSDHRNEGTLEECPRRYEATPMNRTDRP